ncbi:hypothetical protein [Pararobbsia alpina]|uniref:Bacterial Pleckstrin homology domain-containing protein n=1 Tax=Pararobbsia alpina TaxID=621374 RepID=A0A6S7C2J3_9BURK|nr:hypothetical protein [Pararobbsia alpina]CAB3779548.1 hypothetical protein LMG28138_00843 [Pararobbsia alpina]
MRYAETQFPDWRICALMLVALAGLLVWRRAPRLPAWTAMVLLVAGFFECRLATRVDEQAVRVEFGWVPVYSRTIPLADIVSVGTAPGSAPASSFSSPLAQSPAAGAWGWGVRRDRDGTFAMTIRGSQGVVLTLRDGSRLRIGSQEPGALEQALRHVLPTAGPSARCPASAC